MAKDDKLYRIVAHGGIEIVGGRRRVKRTEYGTVCATSRLKALDQVCANFNAKVDDERQHIRRIGFSIPVLGIGSIKAEEIV